MLCDGETDLGNIDFTNEMKRALEKFETDHLIERCEYKKPLNFDQYYRYYDNRYVQTVFWSITGKCNYHCRHCYMDAPDAALGEVSTAEALDFIDQMAECGVLQVDITVVSSIGPVDKVSSNSPPYVIIKQRREGV